MAMPVEGRVQQTGGGYSRMQAAGQAAGLPIGFRFRPTDEELLLHYLRRKALSCPLPADIIPVADLASLHPWELPGHGDGDRYFFHLPATRCWCKGGGAGRVAGTGVWRVSGKEKLVLAPRCKQPVGTKQTLLFCHRGGARSDWAMHEYRLLPAVLGVSATASAATKSPPQVSCHAAEAKDWVVCRVFKKTTPARRAGAGRPRTHGTRRWRDMPTAPASPASSCVTESGKNGCGGNEEEEEEEIASNWP